MIVLSVTYPFRIVSALEGSLEGARGSAKITPADLQFNIVDRNPARIKITRGIERRCVSPVVGLTARKRTKDLSRVDHQGRRRVIIAEFEPDLITIPDHIAADH